MIFEDPDMAHADTFTLPRRVDGCRTETPARLPVDAGGGFILHAKLIGKDSDYVYYALPLGYHRIGEVAATYKATGSPTHRVMRLTEVAFVRTAEWRLRSA